MNLPFEILEKIFLNLHQRDKLKCMLVCHHWKQVMEQGILYDTICLYTADGVEKLTRKISSNSTIGKKVDRLLLFVYDNPVSFINISPILSALPNLRTLYSSAHEHKDFVINRDTQFPFCNGIQHISEEHDDVITPPIVLANTCPQLTSLKIWTSDITALLKNTPNLRSLTAGPDDKGFIVLDAIHKHVPHLQRLQLDFLDLEYSNLRKIDDTPAVSITKCDFDDVKAVIPEKLVNLWKYIVIKYPNITKLKIHITLSMRLTAQDVQMINECGWKPLYQKLGPQLKELGLEGRFLRQNLDLLDGAECRIKRLSIFGKNSAILPQLSASNQILYIETLVLKMTGFKSFHWLKDFKVLATLKFNRESTAIHLPDLLTYAPPTLKTLSLNICTVSIDPEYDGIPSSITSLRFHHLKLPEGTDTFLSRFFPHLSHLKLDNCNMGQTTFNLSTVDLLSFYLVDYFEREFWDRKIMVVSNGESRWYDIEDQTYSDCIDKHLMYLYQPYKSWPVKDMDPEPGFKLICHSLKNIAFY